MKILSRAPLFGLVAAAIAVFYFECNRPTHFPPIPPRPLPSPNAYDFDYMALKSMEAHEKALNIGNSYQDLYVRLSGRQRSDVLQAVTPDLNTVRAGFAFRYAFPRASLETLHNPRAYNLDELAQLFDLEGRMRAGRGDWYGAASSFTDAIKLGVDIPHGSSMAGIPEGRICEEIGRKGLQMVLPHLKMAQLEALRHRLIAIEADRSPFADAVKEDKYISEAWLMDDFKDRNWANKLAFGSEVYISPERGLLGPFIRSGVALNLMIDGKQGLYFQCDRYSNAEMKAAQYPYAAHATMEHVPLNPVATVEDSGAGLDPYHRDDWYETYTVENATRNDMLVVAMALQQYHLKHNSYPRSLSALVPSDLTIIPTDPFTLGKPLQYRQVGSEYLLYSVGPDGINDGGTPIYTEVIQSSKGDIVYGIDP